MLCTLVVLTIHSIFRNLHKALESNSTEAGDGTSLPEDRASVVGYGARVKGPRSRGHRGYLGPNARGRQTVDHHCLPRYKLDGELGSGDDLQNVSDSRKTLQVNE